MFLRVVVPITSELFYLQTNVRCSNTTSLKTGVSMNVPLHVTALRTSACLYSISYVFHFNHNQELIWKTLHPEHQQFAGL
jgi:hypothetical protein